MSRRSPRGPVPSLIGGKSGRPKRATVLRKCECYRCHVSLEAGAVCIEIPRLGSGFSSRRRYCDECFRSILEKSQADLDEAKAL